MLSGAELVKARLAERGLRQKDLVPLFGTESIVSEVLSGKREHGSSPIRIVSRFLLMAPEV